jgi:signal transduction histidine kinase
LCTVPPAQAAAAARTAGGTVHNVPGTVWPILYGFWAGLALAQAHADCETAEREANLAQIAAARDWFETLAGHCAENFRCPALLLGAEAERIQGHDAAALALYEQAIEYSAQPGMIVYSALANELCGKFRLARGQTSLAALFIARAREAYAQWGALAKVDQLDKAYADLLPEPRVLAHEAPAAERAALQSAGADDHGALDLYSVLKAAQVIAGEVELDRLLARLIRIAIENAGAERGCLVLDRDGELLVHAIDALQAGEPALAHGVPLASTQSLPVSIVNYVRRTSESVVLGDAPADDRFGADPYIVQKKPRSVMGVAVQRQGGPIGVLYLEHSLLSGVFTADRIRVMQMLATEAAISLENARLFEGLKREISQRSAAQQQLATALAQVERLKESLQAENVYLRSDLIANVSHDLRTPMVSMRGYLELLHAKGEALPPETRRSYVEIALRQSEYLARLVDELFELAKLDFKGIKLELEAFQLVELASDVLQKFQLAADDKRVRLRVDATGGVPPAQGDLSLIERVLDNLIGNALQHTPSGGSVSVGVAAENGCVVARVRDTGSGIAAADLPHIFDRFYRADKSRRRGGAGLGLGIAQRTVEVHGGAIKPPARGSCFAFSLPELGAG